MIALIDGDIIKYSVGFASDSGGKEEPVNYALHSVKIVISSILETTNSDQYVVYLTGEGNYREKLATIRPYKGNRDRTKKPRWYNEIHDYLVNVHNAVIVKGREADDAMGCAQMKASGAELPTTVICTLDKDLDMIPGLHYNWRKKETRDITLKEADLFFYTQLLTGDRTDNIVGVPGIGKKKAEKIVTSSMDEKQMYEACLAAYAKHYGVADAEKTLKENANLLWIQREENVLWQQP